MAAESLVTTAKVLEITPRGFILMVGTEPLAVEDTPDTRCWKAQSSADRDAFAKGETVNVRIKTDSDPPVLREISDERTWKWLDSIRRSTRKGTLEKVDAKFLHLKFEDGSRFSYRITDKSDLKLSGKTNPSTSDLAPGQTVYVRGRLLPNLDTWVIELSDQPPAAKPSAKPSGSSSSAKPKAVKLPTSGKLEGIILADMPPLNMFDILVDEIRTYHISYNLETKFSVDRKASDRKGLQKGAAVLVTYKRDKYGRLLATKVEIFSR